MAKVENPSLSFIYNRLNQTSVCDLCLAERRKGRLKLKPLDGMKIENTNKRQFISAPALLCGAIIIVRTIIVLHVRINELLHHKFGAHRSRNMRVLMKTLITIPSSDFEPILFLLPCVKLNIIYFFNCFIFRLLILFSVIKSTFPTQKS